jgi:hypothetical protein
VQIVTCRRVTRTVVRKIRGRRKRVKITRQLCTARVVDKPVKFKVSSSRRATLTRGRTILHRGIELGAAKRPELLLSGISMLRAGRYTLTVTWTGRHHRRHVNRQYITVTSSYEDRR